MTINEIMDSIKSNETLIIPIVKDDILLSLTCNLSDTRTYSYAQHYFPGFYDRNISEYTLLCNQVETTHLYERIKKSLDLIQQAKEVFMKRMEVAQ